MRHPYSVSSRCFSPSSPVTRLSPCHPPDRSPRPPPAHWPVRPRPYPSSCWLSGIPWRGRRCCCTSPAAANNRRVNAWTRSRRCSARICPTTTPPCPITRVTRSWETRWPHWTVLNCWWSPIVPRSSCTFSCAPRTCPCARPSCPTTRSWSSRHAGKKDLNQIHFNPLQFSKSWSKNQN